MWCLEGPADRALTVAPICPSIFTLFPVSPNLSKFGSHLISVI
jgi:hypothetical protein